MNSINNFKPFQTITGYNLLEEINYFITDKTCVVTMEDLWPIFKFYVIYVLVFFLIMETSSTILVEPKPIESEREVFVRLANNRVNKVLSSLDVLKKLSSRKSSYTEKDVSEMKKHLHTAVNEAIESFNPSAKSSKKTFSLDI